VDVLSSRILLRPGDLERSRRFYGDVLGPGHLPGVRLSGRSRGGVLPWPGIARVSGHTVGPARFSVMIWIQVREVHAGHARLARTESQSPGNRQPSLGVWPTCGSRSPMASRSSWSRFPPIALSAATCDRRHRQDDDRYADARVPDT